MAEKLQNLVPYSPLEGDYPIRLDANESFLSPPPELLQQIGDAVARIPFNRYPDPYCVALCEKFASFFGVRPSNVVAGNGSDELIGLIVSSFAGAGDRMAVVKPDFSMYAFYAQAAGVSVEVFEKPAETLALDADALVAFARERDVRLVILSNPCNPTSLSASRGSVLRIVEGLPDRLVVIDEAYMDFSTGSVLDVVDRYDNLIVLKTCSKAFGMAAIRLGFAVSHPTLAIALKAAKPPYNVNSMTQAIGCLLFDNPDYPSNRGVPRPPLSGDETARRGKERPAGSGRELRKLCVCPVCRPAEGVRAGGQTGDRTALYAALSADFRRQ